jgi:hypothetical protein
MGKEAAALLRVERSANTYTFEMVDSLPVIVTSIEQYIVPCFEQFAVVTITLDFENAVKIHLHRPQQVQASTQYLLNSLRSLVRKTDIVFLLNSTLYFLLLGANEQGGQIVRDRLWDALLWRVHNLAEQELLQPSSMATGHSAYPTPYSRVDQLLEAAQDPKISFNLQPEKTAQQATAPQYKELQEVAAEDELPLLARKIGVPFLPLLPRKLSRSVQQIVNPKLAQELHCYPVGRERNTLTVAMLDPQDRSALDRLRQETGLLIFPVLTHPRALQRALEQLV